MPAKVFYLPLPSAPVGRSGLAWFRALRELARKVANASGRPVIFFFVHDACLYRALVLGLQVMDYACSPCVPAARRS